MIIVKNGLVYVHNSQYKLTFRIPKPIRNNSFFQNITYFEKVLNQFF